MLSEWANKKHGLIYNGQPVNKKSHNFPNSTLTFFLPLVVSSLQL